jgi:glycosyltransferase involved in cell wall biosynthesis
VAGELVETAVFPGEITDRERAQAQREHAMVLERVLSRYEIDIVHFHGLDFHAYVPRTSAPMLATLHLPLSWYPEAIRNQSSVHLNCVSHSQGDGTGLPVVENGIDVLRYRPVVRKSEYALWLGRICPEKGVHLALEAAHKADIPLVVAGPVHPFASHQKYFRDQVEPLLDDRRRYVGPVAGAAKERLLAEARCLLVTSLVAETCSLVSIEALSSATPVIALRSGALPEVVRQGITGFIIDSVDEICSAIAGLDKISPSQCRTEALTRFSGGRMAAAYLSLYKRILGTGRAPQEALYDSVPRKKFQAV